jgi:hypothetical protein
MQDACFRLLSTYGMFLYIKFNKNVIYKAKFGRTFIILFQNSL